MAFVAGDFFADVLAAVPAGAAFVVVSASRAPGSAGLGRATCLTVIAGLSARWIAPRFAPVAAPALVTAVLGEAAFAAVDFAVGDFAVVDFGVVDFAVVDFAVVGFAVVDFAVVGFSVADFAVVEFPVVDFAVVDFPVVDFAALDFAVLDFAVLDFGVVALAADPPADAFTAAPPLLAPGRGFEGPASRRRTSSSRAAASSIVSGLRLLGKVALVVPSVT